MSKTVQIIVDAVTWKPIRLATPAENFKPMIFRWRGRLVRVTEGKESEIPTKDPATPAVLES